MPPRRTRGGSDPGHAVPTETAAAAAPTARAEPQPVPQVATASTRSLLSKLIPKPDKFNGRGDVALFIYGLINYFTLVALADATEMTDDFKILMTATFLSEAALTWYRTHASKYRLFTKLCEALEDQFGDKNIETNARAKLERLKQTGSINAYITTFQETGLLLSTTESDFFDTHEAHHAFTRGLQKDIRTAVAMSQMGRKDCREAILLATQYDAARRLGEAGTSREPEQTNDRKVHFNVDQTYPRFNNNHFGSNKSNHFGNKQRHFSGNKFNNARVNSANTGADGPSTRVCWNCGSPDHFNDACPDPPKNARLAAQRSAAQRRK